MRKTILWQSLIPAFMALVLVFGGLAGCKAPPEAAPPVPQAPPKAAPVAPPVAAPVAPPVAAPAVSFKGKTITMVIAVGAGGGTDLTGRPIAWYLRKYLPGEPDIIVRNMIAAGGIAGCNYAYKAKGDGLTVQWTTTRNHSANKYRMPGMDARLEEMKPILTYSGTGLLYMKTGIIPGNDPYNILQAKGIIFGHGPPTEGSTQSFIWAKEFLGFPVQDMILGYAGSGPANLALLAGEINASWGSVASYTALIPYVEKGEVMPVCQMGIYDAKGNIVRDPLIPDVPTEYEIYKKVYGKEPSPGFIWEVYKADVSNGSCFKVLVLPPTTPEPILDVYRQAAVKLVKDPEFLAVTKNMVTPESWFYGEGLIKAYPYAVSLPPDILKQMKEFMTKNYGVVFD